MQASRCDAEPSPPIPTHHTSSPTPRFTLLVAGCSGGKSSFLRLLLDTCHISPNAPKAQLADVLSFIETSAEPTTSLRNVTLDLLGDLDGSDHLQRFELTLIDTPSFQFSAPDPLSDRLVLDIISLIDSRLAGALDEHVMPEAAERFITLCIYFLDPEKLLPPSSSSRTVGHDQPSIFLDHQNVQIIRQLAERVNVLPVICKADTMTNEVLAAVKFAVRRDLAEAGIGFGIFDRYRPPHLPAPEDMSTSAHYQNNGHISRSLSDPSVPSIGGMPYTLISPDLFAHSDGIFRVGPTRAELMQQYKPCTPTSPKPLPQGRFVRTYRWGRIDVLDPNHCDFTLLKFAVFRHLQTLHDYTKGYLFDKFKSAYVRRQSDTSPLSDSSNRPALAINTAQASSHILGRATTVTLPSSTGGTESVGSNPSTSTSARSAPATKAPKHHRSRKITVACQFCRSRKLKCDGGRPACSQCSKRSHPCDYLHGRRGPGKRKGEEESETDSAEVKSEETEESPSTSRPSSTQNRTVLPLIPQSKEGFIPSLPPMRPHRDEFEESTSSSHSKSTTRYVDTELPHIATLSLPEISPTTSAPLSASFPPLRPPEQKPATSSRKRAATVPTKNESGRLPGVSGPKVVACNFCRARKTKCDGSHPCQQCAKRSLPCNYVHDSGSRRGGRRGGASMKAPESPNSPSSRVLPTTTSPEHSSHQQAQVFAEDEDKDRLLEDSDGPPPKRMRVSDPKSLQIPS